MFVKSTFTPRRLDLDRLAATPSEASRYPAAAPVPAQRQMPPPMATVTEEPSPTSRAAPGSVSNDNLRQPVFTNAEYVANRRRITLRADALRVTMLKKGRRVQYVGNAVTTLGLAGFVATIAVPLAVPSQRIHPDDAGSICRVIAMGAGSLALFAAGLYAHHKGTVIIDAPNLGEVMAMTSGRLTDVENFIPGR